MHPLNFLGVLFAICDTANTTPLFAPNVFVNSRQSSLANCLAANNVPTSYITSSDWSSLATPYNLRLSYSPTAITLPTTPQHVVDSVTCAVAVGVKVQAKSGGHSYASYSSGGQDGSLIVDMQEFNSIVVDQATGIATVGCGARLGNMALGIYEQGGRALPHGTCPGVGVGGHFTHGGYGYDSRAWGLALDTIVGLDVVLANGTFVHATSISYPQIFFALRGAADSFGIITTFYLQTLPAPPTIANFAVSIPAVLSSATVAANAFLSLQNFALTSSLMTRNLTFGIYTDGNGFSLNGWYIGDQTYFTNTILPAMLTGFPAPQSTSVRALGWLESLANEAGGSLMEPLTGYNAHDTFYAKSVTTRESQPLTFAALQSFFSYAINEGRSPGHPWFSIINLYGGLDSQINAIPVSSSAYSDRDSLWVFQNYGYTSNSQPPYDPSITTFITNLTLALTLLQPTGQFGAYLNYVDPDLTPQQAAFEYYGTELYNQLTALKSVVDPNAVFWNPQAIGNAKLSPTSSSIPPTLTSTSPPSSQTPSLLSSSMTSTSHPASTLTASQDGSCAGTTGQTCHGSPLIQPGLSSCCSKYGYCGSTIAYCGDGCQRGFGDCNTPGITPPSSSAAPPPPASTLTTSHDGSCGGSTGETCLGSPIIQSDAMACCSQWGYCGSTTAYCGTGCQASFGECS